MDNVASDLQGRFELKDGVLSALAGLVLGPRRAESRCAAATRWSTARWISRGPRGWKRAISEMVTGWKRFPLKLLDPLFAKDGAGAVFPIRVSGPVKKPEFKVEIKKIFKG